MTTYLKRITPWVILILVSVAGWRLLPETTPIIQPIAYNHNLHVEGQGLECIDCHSNAESMPAATIPDLAVCEDCHDTDPLSESPEETKLIAHIEEGREVDWQRIYRVPDHVYFSHRRHVTLGEVSCSTCHGNVAQQREPVRAPVNQITMEWCLDCHRENKVSNDCLACHH